MAYDRGRVSSRAPWEASRALVAAATMPLAVMEKHLRHETRLGCSRLAWSRRIASQVQDRCGEPAPFVGTLASPKLHVTCSLTLRIPHHARYAERFPPVCSHRHRQQPIRKLQHRVQGAGHVDIGWLSSHTAPLSSPVSWVRTPHTFSLLRGWPSELYPGSQRLNHTN